MSVSNMGHPLADFFTVGNAFFCGPNVPASASFTLDWRGVQDRYSLRNDEVGFAGHFSITSATLEWSASNADGYHYLAEPFVADPSANQGFALVGKMRNGKFLR